MRERGGLEVEAPLRSPGLPAGQRVGGGQRCPPEGTWHLSHHGRPGRCQSSEGTMAVAIKRPETITYEEKNGQKPLNMILSGKSLNLFVSMQSNTHTYQTYC